MAGGKKNVIQTRPDGKECFECANTGFQIRRRVFFDHEFLKTHGLVSMLGPLSFIDWNNALAYCQQLNKDGKMEDSKFYNIMNHIRTLHGLMIGASIYIPKDIKTYPKDMEGYGPKEYSQQFMDEEQLLYGSQSVEEYKIWLTAKNRDVPKVLTQEQIEKKKQNMNALKTRHTLNFLVEVPASKIEVQEEDKRVSEIEAEEKKLEEETPAGGKRKNLTKQKLSAKRRKINKDGFRPMDYVAGETNSANLVSNLIGSDQAQLLLTVKSTKNADGEPRTTIHFTHPNSGAEKLRFVLPGNL
jgi:hypothetical protein